ncbi:MAG: HlyD family efflux transporter periplasmic adaptor subunit [Pirellulales bacterium]
MDPITAEPDNSVRELGLARLRLRGDLAFTPQSAVGEPYYMVEDALNSRFFRLGLVEYSFISLLDGTTTIHDALSLLSSVLPHHRLTENDAAILCRWLVEMDLAHTDASSRGARLARAAQTSADRKALAQWNPLAFRLPLGRPDKLFEKLAGWLGWLHSPAAFAVWVALAASGGYVVLSDWERFAASSRGVFAPHNWLWLAACWIVLKIVHETSHGVACRRYGGTVRETGLLFIFLAPLAYVDVTSSWRFRRRRERMHVAAAGMYWELGLAAVAALVWSKTSSVWLGNLCFNAVFMASLSTLLFNANPLMKFDGYYILSEGLALPNLYANGQHYLRYWAKRYLLAVPASLPNWSRRDAGLIRLYGLLACVWRVLVSAGLAVTAVAMFHGAGVVLAAVAGVAWLGLPAVAFARYLAVGKRGEHPSWKRFAATVGTTAACAVLVLCFVPWPGVRTAPAVVEYSPHTILRAASAGFVRKILVRSGQQVQPGQLLVVLENKELACELASLELRLRQSVLRGQRHEQKKELALEQAEAQARESLLTQMAEKRDQLEQLLIRAPHAGSVVRRGLAAMADTYLKRGDEVLVLGDETKKELRVALAQDDMEAFTRHAGQPVQIDVPRYPVWLGQVASVTPRASVVPTHSALIASHGGPLPVRPAARQPDQPAADAYELLVPHFAAIIPLAAADSRQLHSGQLASIRYRPCHESIGQHLFQALSQWVRERMRSAAA